MTMPVTSSANSVFASGRYWKKRSNLVYYQYVRQIMDTIATPGASVVDVGSGNTPYLDWFDWASYRLSVDIRVPYASEKVEGLQADILTHDFGRRFDFCTCLQVLEHLDEPRRFTRRLFEIADVVVVSVPYRWPRGAVKWHPQDPVDERKLASWTGTAPDYEIVVTEPMKFSCDQRLICVYDPLKINSPVQELRARNKKRGRA